MDKKIAGEKKTLLLALIISLLVFLPFIIYNDGVFVYMGDYNAQQIPFYKLAHEAVRSGDILWNWNTDLGANFIGSYSFYLLFSPFFWLTLPFPTSFVPYLMGPLLILKTTLAALTSYLYIKRYVKNKDYAVLGSILYAFSGFMIFNIFFNHFHDVVVFFPLLMVSLDELAENGKKGWFALMVAVSAIVNYWFFIGEAVFVFIYVMIRIATDKKWKSWKKFLSIAFESVLGVGIACFVLLPSALAIMGNPRTGASKLISGDLTLTYGFRERLPAIIESFFFPPEMPSRPSLFPDMGAKWASLSAWLPLFTTIGVIAYIKEKKNDTVKRVIITSFIMSIVPVFNAAFVLFNGSYYARWFYMPILFLVIATAVMLEKREETTENLKSGFLWTASIVLTFIFFVGFWPNPSDEGKIRLGMYGGKTMFILLSFTAIVCLIISCVIIFTLKDEKVFLRTSFAAVSAVIVLFSWAYMLDGKSSKAKDDEYLDLVLNGREDYALPEDEFYRTDFFECRDNMGMLIGRSTINAFHSIVPPSVMEFYPYVGIKRDVSSKPPVSFEELRPLTSVKYLFVKESNEKQPPIEGYVLYKKVKGYNIYENPDFIPMGFIYDRAVSKEHLDRMSGQQRLKYMLSSVVLDSDAIERNRDILKAEKEADYILLEKEYVDSAVEDKKNNSCREFKIDNRGFSADIDAKKKGLLFFSVPYDEGWSAYVNGKPAFIEKANAGFMAVRVDEGINEIRFNYIPKGLGAGIIISLISSFVLLLYLLISLKRQGIKEKEEANGGSREIVIRRDKFISDPLDERLLTLEEIKRRKE